MKALWLATACLIACGGDDGGSGTVDAADGDGGTDDAGGDAPAAAFALTSPAWTEGAAIPPAHSCDGANTSPALTWTSPPAGTMSFAVVLTDRANSLVHSVIYDIPATATGLPENVEKVYAPTNVPGAHQTRSFAMTVVGYNGPCPRVQDPAHTYEFALYALNVATLPGATMMTTRAAAVTTIEANDLEKVLLTGTFDR